MRRPSGDLFLLLVSLVGFGCAANSGGTGPESGADGGRLGADGAAPSDGATDPLASQLTELRGVVHVHSVYSHDACDGDGLPGGAPNQSCWEDLRAAVCSVGLDFVGLTDHPSHMREYSMDGELLYDPARGDQLVLEGGATVANRLHCDDGHEVLVTEGYEGPHTLPIAFSTQPSTDSAYGALIDARPLAEVQAMVAELKAHGAVVASAHSEEDDLSAATLLASGAEAMEWYNPHGNFKTVLGAEDGIGLGALGALDLLGSMSPYLAGASSGAHPDLVYLLLLPKWPQKGFDKWREVQRTRSLTGLLGSDVHQNVSVDPLCTGTLALACQLAAQGSTGKTQALALLSVGGQIIMSDGRRLDSYERILRWLENRLLVEDSSPAGVRAAIRAGRNYGLFSVFGAPEGLRFVGQAGGALLELGAEHAGPIALTVRVPTGALPLTGAQWSAAEGAKIELRASLYRTSDTETTLVKESRTLGETLSFDATLPGAYHLEVWARPKHLAGALGTESAQADTEYLWLITNPIRVLP